MSYCSYGGKSIARLSLLIPWTGVWVADVEFATADPIPTVGTLAMGNLSLHGGIWRVATRWGQASARLAGGAATLSRGLPARGYAIQGGLLASTVAGDVGVETGERVNVASSTDRSLPFWSRVPGPGGDTLTALFGDAWWIDTSGVIQCGPRSSSAISSTFTATEWRGGPGVITVATEDPASWMPGNTFANAQIAKTQTAVMVRHFFGNDGALRTKVMV